MLHQGNPARVIVLGGWIVDDLSGAGVEVVGDVPLRLQPLFAALDGGDQREEAFSSPRYQSRTPCF